MEYNSTFIPQHYLYRGWPTVKAREHQGRCRDCGGEAAPGRIRCYTCLRIAAIKIKIRRAQLKEAGLCVVCGKVPPDSGRVRCRACLEKIMCRYRKREEKKKNASSTYNK